MKLYKIASIALIILGFIHLTAHVVGSFFLDEQAINVMSQMENYKIKLFGEHSFLKFHTGFSLMMGLLISAFGVQNLLMAKSLNKHYLISTIIITALALAISILYLHFIPILFITISLICYTLTYKKL